MTPVNPVFGLPSLLSFPVPPTVNKEAEVDAMDWSPTGALSEDKRESAKQPDDGSWLRPQRFFPPEKPTGLEGLFERTLLVNDSPAIVDNSQRRPYIGKHWWLVYALSVAPIVAITYKVWEIMRWGV